jgi:hypothetical protein
MEIFSFSKGFRLYKLLIKCESLLLLTPTFLLLLNKPTISEAYKSTGLTVWSNICIEFGAEQGILGKYVLGVNKRTTNLAIYGELGRYPLYIDTIISMIKYWVRLCKNTHHDPLPREAYEENLLMYGRMFLWLIFLISEI